MPSSFAASTSSLVLPSTEARTATRSTSMAPCRLLSVSISVSVRSLWSAVTTSLRRSACVEVMSPPSEASSIASVMRRLLGVPERPSIRLRLTLSYGALFLLTGTVLLALNFALVARNFPSGGEDLRESLEERLDFQSGELRGEFTFLVQGQPVRGKPGVFRAVPASALFDNLVSQVKEDTLRELLWQFEHRAGAHGRRLDRPRLVRGRRMLRPVHTRSPTPRAASPTSASRSASTSTGRRTS